MRRLKVLILMSTIGGGHASVAKALQEELEAKGHEVVFFDALPQVLVPTYSIITRYLLPFWGFLFWTSNEKRASDIVSRIGNKIVEKKIAQKVISTTPDFIISDHPFITKLPDDIFWKNGHVPLGVMVVDPVTVHSIWFKGKPDVYFVPTEQIEKMAVKAGVEREKIVFTGYPVRKEFSESIEVGKIRRLLGFGENKLNLVIGGSSEGVGKIEDLCEGLASFGESYEFQAIVVCGRNKKLFKKLAGLYYYDNRFKILGFESKMALYLKICDMVISKAGPTNLYEAVAAEKPFIAFSCMPGQEEGNLDLIKKEKIGIVEKDIGKILRLIKKFIKNPKLLEEFRPGIVGLRKKQMGAAERIVEFVEKYVNKK